MWSGMEVVLVATVVVMTMVAVGVVMMVVAMVVVMVVVAVAVATVAIRSHFGSSPPAPYHHHIDVVE